METQLFSIPILFTSFIFIVMLWRTWRKSNTKGLTAELPPGPWKLPLIGNMHHLIGSLPHRRLKDLATRYGPLMHLKFGEVNYVVVSSPEMAKEVMKTHDINFAQRPHILAANIVSYNCTNIAFSPYGDYWRQLRKICILELLSAKRVESFQSIREEEVSNLIRSISSNAGAVINLSKMLFSLTYSITSRITFGKKGKEPEAFIQIVKEIAEASGGFSLADFFPSVKLLHVISGMRYTLETLHHKADEILENIINEHSTSQNSDVGEAHDLVDVLLNIRECGDLEFPLTIDNIKAVLLDLFIAGSETSSSTLEWTIAEMLKTPQVMEKAQAEVRRVFQGNRGVKESGLHELKYLKLVIKETLRLHPPVPLLLPRECREKCEINGYEIPVKTTVIVNAWAIGRDPDHWIDAESFCPERFIDSPVDYKGANFELIPFGAGRRMCPGISFGIADVELPLVQLLYHFDWKLPGEMNQEDVDMTENFGSITQRKSDLNLIPIPYHPFPI